MYLSSLASALHHMSNVYASEYIIRLNKSLLLRIHTKGIMHFCRDILLNYCIVKWHTSTPYDIFRNQSNYPTLCLLLNTSHRTDNYIPVCGKWIFDSNFEATFLLTQYCLTYIWRGNETDEIRCVDVLHDIRAVPPKVVQRRLNMK